MTSRPGIIVTGGAKRVGAALAMHFARGGYDIALHYHQSKTEAEALKKDIESLGAKCALFSHDMQNTKGIPALMETIHKTMPGCTALINNASVFERAMLMDTDEALFDRQLNINFKAPFFLTQAFAKYFGKGCIINVLDTDIVETQGSHFAYLLSKKTLAEFTLMAARELGPNIRVNGVCPGIILPSSDLDQNYMDKLAPSLPLEALASLEQLSVTTQWLLEHKALTGQLLFIDGGQHLL